MNSIILVTNTRTYSKTSNQLPKRMKLREIRRMGKNSGILETISVERRARIENTSKIINTLSILK